MRIGRALIVAAFAIAAIVVTSCGGSGIGNSFGQVPGIYFVDGGNNRMVWVSDIAGTQSSLFDSTVTGVTSVVDATMDPTGRFYMIDGGSDAVVRFDDLQGDGRASFGSHGSAVGQFLDPARVAADSAGTVYVVDRGRNALVRFTTNGSIWQTLDLSTWFSAGSNPSLAVDAFGHILLAGGSKIVKLQGFTATNAVTYGTSGTGTGNFNNLSAICQDTLGKIYVADTGNNRIVRINDMTGAGWAMFGVSGTGTGDLSAPSGVGLDHNGLIYIGDSNNHRIVRIDNMNGDNWTELDNLGAVSFGQPGAIFPHLPAF